MPLLSLSPSPLPSLCLEGYPPPDPGKKCNRLLGGLSSFNSTHWRGTKGLMWGARGLFLPAAAMVVMVVLGSWSLGLGAALENSLRNFFSKTFSSKYHVVDMVCCMNNHHERF